MSDDLVKRLRSALTYKDLALCPKAADRIEALEVERDALAEKLEMAVEALEKVSQLITEQYADRLYTQTTAGWEHCSDDIKDVARATLAKITGETDDQHTD